MAGLSQSECIPFGSLSTSGPPRRHNLPMIPRHLFLIAAFLLLGSYQQKSSFTMGGAPLDLSNIRPRTEGQVPTTADINNMLWTGQPPAQAQQPVQQQQQAAQPQQPAQAPANPQVTQEQIQLMMLKKLVEDQGKQLQDALQQTQHATQQMKSFEYLNSQLKHDLQLVNGHNAQLQLHINQLEASVQQLQQNLQNGQSQLEQAWEGSHQLEAYNNRLLGQVNQLQENKMGLELEIERLREMELVERDLRLQQQAQYEKEKRGSKRRVPSPLRPDPRQEGIERLSARLDDLKRQLEQTRVTTTAPIQPPAPTTPAPTATPTLPDPINPRSLDEIERDLAELYKRNHARNSTRTQGRPQGHRLNIITHL